MGEIYKAEKIEERAESYSIPTFTPKRGEMELFYKY